jgi:hypothetical protein
VLKVLGKENCQHSQIIVEILKFQILLDTKLDNLKRKLAQTKDFNLMDAFRIFDMESKGYVTSIELW